MTEASTTLDRLAAEFWAGTLAAGPLEATATGIREYDDRIDDIAPAAIAAGAVEARTRSRPEPRRSPKAAYRRPSASPA
jgi:hypothetical protein